MAHSSISKFTLQFFVIQVQIITLELIRFFEGDANPLFVPFFEILAGYLVQVHGFSIFRPMLFE